MELFAASLIETKLSFIVFRPKFEPIALRFLLLVILKSLHWLADEQIDHMEQGRATGRLFHIKLTILSAILALLDYVYSMEAYNGIITEGPSSQLIFGIEYGILIVGLLHFTLKYLIHGIEMRNEITWDRKIMLLLYAEPVTGLVKAILYVLYVVIMVKLNALPIFVIRPLYRVIRDMKQAISGLIASWRTMRNIDELYPDATPEDLKLFGVHCFTCIICREDMVSDAKKLPCSHMFHKDCLKSWFQIRQTCPTCRFDFLRAFSTAELLRRAARAKAAAENQNNPGN